MRICRELRQRHMHQYQTLQEATSCHIPSLSTLAFFLAPMMCILLFCLFPIGAAQPQEACTLTLPVYEGQHVSLTADPSGDG